MYEDQKQKFAAKNLWELGMIADEIEEWIHEMRTPKKDKKTTRHTKM
jgi:hypothetical protein